MGNTKEIHLPFSSPCLYLQKGTKAPQAAGRIHTDFERGFIMAEIMNYADFKEFGSEAECKVVYLFHTSFCFREN